MVSWKERLTVSARSSSVWKEGRHERTLIAHANVQPCAAVAPRPFTEPQPGRPPLALDETPLTVLPQPRDKVVKLRPLRKNSGKTHYPPINGIIAFQEPLYLDFVAHL